MIRVQQDASAYGLVENEQSGYSSLFDGPDKNSDRQLDLQDRDQILYRRQSPAEPVPQLYRSVLGLLFRIAWTERSLGRIDARISSSEEGFQLDLGGRKIVQ
jgi:hypothetical protein